MPRVGARRILAGIPEGGCVACLLLTFSRAPDDADVRVCRAFLVGSRTPEGSVIDLANACRVPVSAKPCSKDLPILTFLSPFAA